jgi:hypothetical protein
MLFETLSGGPASSARQNFAATTHEHRIARRRSAGFLHLVRRGHAMGPLTDDERYAFALDNMARMFGPY